MATEELVRQDFKDRTSGGKAEGVTGDGVLQNQRTDSDWVELNPEDFSYNSSTILNVANLDPTTYLADGDMLRVKQSGSYKYFYIIGRSTTTITVNGGNLYTVANSTVQQISYSRGRAALGHPIAMPYTATFSTNGAGTLIINSQDLKYTMNGRVVNLFGSFNYDVTSAAITDILFTLPFSMRSTSVLAQRCPMVVERATDSTLSDIINMSDALLGYTTDPDRVWIIGTGTVILTGTGLDGGIDVTYYY